MIQQGALDGIRVLDLSRMLPGPYCSMILADHGAEVIGIEDRSYKGDGLFFSELYRNKRHMSLNLKSEQGKEIFFRLADKADVILEGFRPGVSKRLGVDYDSLQKRNPRIIYCSITGYGQTGPLRHRPGHDLNFLSDSGVLHLIGEKGRQPIIPGVQIADIAGGSMNAAIGILLALLAREKTQKGQFVDISMSDGVAGLLSLPSYFASSTGSPPQVGDSLLSHRYGCYNTYKTADGRFVAIGAVENKFWKRLCEHLGLSEFIELQYDEERRTEIIEALTRIFRGRTLAEWDKELGEIEACYSPVKNLSEIFTDPNLVERQMIHSFEGERGELRHSFGVAVKLSETPGSIRTEPSGFGADTTDILSEIGYGADRISHFIDTGVV